MEVFCREEKLCRTLLPVRNRPTALNITNLQFFTGNTLLQDTSNVWKESDHSVTSDTETNKIKQKEWFLWNISDKKGTLCKSEIGINPDHLIHQ